MENISHYELCQLTAENFIKKTNIALFEYQSYSTDEFPDVLTFKNGRTQLYEIKVSYQDFKKDLKKECRIEKKVKYWTKMQYNSLDLVCGLNWQMLGLEEFYREAPHLGRKRFYVCPQGLIQPDEVLNGWGLYWFNGVTFKKKKESKNFRVNIYAEMRILEHAFRKKANGYSNNIIVNEYKFKT